MLRKEINRVKARYRRHGWRYLVKFPIILAIAVGFAHIREDGPDAHNHIFGTELCLPLGKYYWITIAVIILIFVFWPAHKPKPKIGQ
ncbi:MAG: hypothetical protein ABJN52_05755 [Litorimonas sp.]